ncbi:hypothetical protein EV401DRAFT_2026225 [Pisolithus croceorrhizus]|nr:hypothetical protein EV401DRAFT_2026225 [Pisolithus croceorrhizus]
MVDVLPMFEVGSTGQAWYGKHAKEHQAPDEGDSQCAGTNSEMIANVPDPPGTPTKLSTLQVEHSRLRNSPSARVHSAMSMETNLSCTGRSGKRREMQRLKLDCKRAPGRPKRTYQGCSTSETPPDEVWGMGVYGSAGAGWGYGTIAEHAQRSLIRLRILVVEVMMQLARTSSTHAESRKHR